MVFNKTIIKVSVYKKYTNAQPYQLTRHINRTTVTMNLSILRCSLQKLSNYLNSYYH